MKRKHFHRYERFYWPSHKPYYKCMEPGCGHYLTIAEHVIGRESLCWGPGCNKLVVITKEDVQNEIKHPMCDDCKEERMKSREALSNIK